MVDNIKVNAGDWSGLSSEDQEKVTRILTSTGLLQSGDNITPDPSAASATGVGTADAETTAFSFCTIACDIAQAAATAACAALSGPAVAVCIAAAKAGGDFCRSKC